MAEDKQYPAILLIGEHGHREFAAAVAWLETNAQLTKASTAADAFACGQLDARSVPWHTVVFAQSRPGVIAWRDIERVSRVAPLAHLVALLGSWCEGETRSGKPWPGVVRCYWHQWPARCGTELRPNIAPTSWQLPRTSSDWERTNHALRQPVAGGSGMVAIHSRTALSFQALAQACRLAGFAAARLTPSQTWAVQGAAAVLWDGPIDRAQDHTELQELAQRVRPVPLIALLAFPRFHQVERARQGGVAAVISCPFLLTDLWATLSDVTGQGVAPVCPVPPGVP